MLAVVQAVESVAANPLPLFGVGLGWSLSFDTATGELADLTTPTQRVHISRVQRAALGFARDGVGPTGGVVLAAVGLAGHGMAILIRTAMPAVWILRSVPKPPWTTPCRPLPGP